MLPAKPFGPVIEPHENKKAGLTKDFSILRQPGCPSASLRTRCFPPAPHSAFGFVECSTLKNIKDNAESQENIKSISFLTLISNFCAYLSQKDKHL